MINVRECRFASAQIQQSELHALNLLNLTLLYMCMYVCMFHIPLIAIITSCPMAPWHGGCAGAPAACCCAVCACKLGVAARNPSLNV